MSNKPFKLLFWGDYNCNTGFATVSKNILPALRNHFGDRMYMDIIAINYIQNDENGVAQPGKTYKTDNDRTVVVPAINEQFYNAKGEQTIDELGRHEFLSRLYTYDYDIVFIINDPGVLAGKLKPDGLAKGNILREIKNALADKKATNRKQPKIVYYFPVDSTPQSYLFDDFDILTTAVTYTEYARKEVYKLKPNLKGKIKVIPHGINRKDFYPILFNDDFRKEYFGENADKIIFANINRNQPRKDIPTTIFGFEQFLKTTDTPSLLYLHMKPDDSLGWDLWWLLQQTSLVEGKDYVFPNKEIGDTSVKTLNKIYNSCDYFITTTSGEGWGLSITESMACRIPVLAPMHTSISEIGGADLPADKQRIIFFEEQRPYVTHFDNNIRIGCEYEEVAEKMEYVVKEMTAEQKVTMIDRAYQYTQSIDWNIINERWIEEFDKLV